MDKDILKKKIIEANKAYRAGHPIMDDLAFDSLVETYQKLVSNEEFNAFRDSLHEVKGKVKHQFIMGSLDKLKYELPEEVAAFIKTCADGLNVSCKVDGISCRLHYENGKLVSASTRGDGEYGESLTDKISYVKNVPMTIATSEKSLDVRGELVITKEDFAGLEGFANARNAVAGMMGRKDWNADDIKNVTFVAYTILGPKFSKDEQFSLLEDLGSFKVAWHKTYSSEEASSNDFIDKMFELASVDYGFDTDGLVVCSPSYHNEEKYRPDACKAFKINQLSAETTLIDVAFDGPSKNGFFTPVGIIEPVNLGGAEISRVSLYNLDFIDEMNLKYGSKVVLTRSGDVIPRITKLVCNPPTSKDIVLPDICSCCGSKLVRDGVNLRCANKGCVDQVVNQIVLFIKNLGVKSASNATLKNFGITSFKDLVEFEPNKKYKSEIKLADELNDKMFSRSKLDLLCNMTCFDGLAETMLRKIITFYASKGSQLEDFFFACDLGGYSLNTNMKSLWIERYGLPNGVSDVTLDKFQSGLNDAYNNTMLIVNNLKYHGHAAFLDNPEVSRKQSNGQSVCFTGTLSSMSRSQASEMAKNAGFEVKSGVSKGLTYLVTNNIDSGSSKAKKAKELGTKVISEKQFLALIQENTIEQDVFDI